MDALTKIALVGTAKGAQEPAGSAAPIEELLAGVGDVDRERRLLLRAAAEETYRLAGYVAQPGITLPDPAPIEHRKVCSLTIAGLVGEMLAGQDTDLLLEALRLLSDANLRLPPDLLLAALRTKAEDRRAALRPVLGERGRWLSRFNSEWTWATAEDMEAEVGLPANAETLWQEGSGAQRLAILRRVRAEDAPLARSWIEGVWREEKADFRNDMLDVLSTTLTPDDEPLLERALDDRAPTVRARAAGMLATIPGSALAGRMRERAESLLRYEAAPPAGRLRSLLRSVLSASDAPGVLRVTLPETLDKPWQRDGVVAKPPEGVGQHTWWLTQTLALVPPTHWEMRFGANAADLIAVAAGDDSGLAVIEGWSRAALLHTAPDWARTLWQWWKKTNPSEKYYANVRTEMLGDLLSVMPRQEVEQFVMRNLKPSDLQMDVYTEVLQAIPPPWSMAFGEYFLDMVQSEMKWTSVYTWHPSLSIAAHALPPPCFERALKLLSPAGEHAHGWYVRPSITTMEIRQRLYEEIKL